MEEASTTADQDVRIHSFEESMADRCPDESTRVLSTHSSPSDSDESDMESEAEHNLKLQTKLQTLESELVSNPSNYDIHFQYIQCLRLLGYFEKLRDARENMNRIFPMTPVMWQQWAQDEISFSCSRPDFYHAIQKLYERGVSEYLSVPLWCDYMNFVQQYDPSVCECAPAGILKVRNLFERAITAAGLHVTEGCKIWDAYREFEQAVLLTIDDTDTKIKENQRIRSLFHRQLSLPLMGLESTLSDYKAWETEHGNGLDANSRVLNEVSSQVLSFYEKALEMYTARFSFEEQLGVLVSSEPEKLQTFLAYLKYEESCGDPVRVQVLFERGITEFPISSDLWIYYSKYLDKALKVGNVLKTMYSRAVKNCPWVGEIWVRYLLSLERDHASEEEICDVFERSLQCTFTSFDEYLELFLTRVDGIRRRILVRTEDDGIPSFDLIRKTFQHSSDYLAPNLSDDNNLLRLYSYWSHLELKIGGDVPGARNVWESLLKIRGTNSDVWKSYIAMEINLGHIREARALYRRCYSKRFQGRSEDICYSWLQFEREYGTLEDFDLASQKVIPRLYEIQVFNSRLEKVIDRPTDKKSLPEKKNRQGEKRKLTSDSLIPPVAKRPNDSSKRKFVSEKVEVKVEAEGGLVERDERIENTSKIAEQEGHTSHKKTSIYRDNCTAFISNLSLQAKDEHVRGFFGDGGGVAAIRILHNKFTGKSRGLAYVDFVDDAYLATALAKNKKLLLGKSLSIARSNPSQKRSEKPSKKPEKDEGKDDGGGKNSKTEEDDEGVQFRGRSIFALPRSVQHKANPKTSTEEDVDVKPKSNDEFRKLLLPSH